MKKTPVAIVFVLAAVLIGSWLIWLNEKSPSHDRGTDNQNLTDSFQPQGPILEVGDDGWTTYTDKGFGFSIRYPSSWFYETTQKSFFVTPLSPDDKKRSSDIGVLSSLVIKKASSQDFLDIQKIASSETNVQTIGSSGTLFVIQDVFTGGTTRIYFFPIATNQYLRVVFHNDIDPEKYPFEAIVNTLKTSGL